MRYEYSLFYNDVQSAWQVVWTGFDENSPHSMKGDVGLCRSFDEAIVLLRSYAAQFEPDRLPAGA
ncbi:MAG: hypothetical protein O3B95_11545 [Chloroflexi bacterium]|nr:hypothetical protein [Chloroflexota bacterium]